MTNSILTKMRIDGTDYDIADQSARDTKLNNTYATTEAGKVLGITSTGAVEPTTVSGPTTWGSITGTLSNQTDLQEAIEDRVKKTKYEAEQVGKFLGINSEGNIEPLDVTATTNWGDIEGDITDQEDLSTALAGKQDSHIVIAWNDTPTDFGYPSEKLVKDSLDDKENLIEKKTAFNCDFGQTVDTVCEGNDNRLYNSRDPNSHFSTHGKDGADKVYIDASQVTTGTFDIARLPSGSFQKLIVVADETARKALTASDVNKGDTVKQNDTGIMYFVLDTSKLSTDDGWMVYTAITPWASISGKPTMPKGADGTLTASGWNTDTKQQTVNVSGVTSSCYVIVEPTPASYETYIASDILCTAQADGSLTFKCTQIPSIDVNFSVVMVFN